MTLSSESLAICILVIVIACLPAVAGDRPGQEDVTAGSPDAADQPTAGRELQKTFEEASEILDDAKNAIEGKERASDRKPFSLDDPELGPLMKSQKSDGAESPRALVERLVTGLKAGDAASVAGCFDRSTEDGRMGAAGFGIVTRLYEAALKLESKARSRFGEPGAVVIRLAMEDSLENTLPEAHAATELNPKTVTLFGEETSGRVVVRLPIRQIVRPSLLNADENWPAMRMIEKRGDRWYLIEPTLWKVSDLGKTLLDGQISVWSGRTDSHEFGLEIIDSCQTLDDLRDKFDVPEESPSSPPNTPS